MLDNFFDIDIVRWINFFMIIIIFFIVQILSKRTKKFYLEVPLLIWLLQSLIFYSIYFLYSYGVCNFQISFAEKFFSYWATMSKSLGLVTVLIYLYYVRHSCWRGNGKL